MSCQNTRRDILKAVGGLCLAATGYAEPSREAYSFWVFGLLKPMWLRVAALGQARLHCTSRSGAFILEPGRDILISSHSVPLRACGPEGTTAGFTLEVPGVLRRSYCGSLSIDAYGELLVPIVTMDPETAVGSIVSAELPLVLASEDAVKAQAVVARSYLTATAHPRHSEAWFCDTTHCQFLREPAPADSMVDRSVRQTKGVVLSTGSTLFPARYSAACGGTTEAGLREGYWYESIRCETCRERRLTRRGHGFGLCQEGAIGLAHRGRKWPQILAEYFPGATLTSI